MQTKPKVGTRFPITTSEAIDLDRMFMHFHWPDESQADRITAVIESARDFAIATLQCVQPGIRRDRAMSHIEEALLSAQCAIRVEEMIADQMVVTSSSTGD